LALCLSGTLLLVHHPMLLSGLARVQTDPGDTRLNNYFLEHSYLWLKQVKYHESFWDPPFYYPHRNAAAYSDLLVGLAPLYWPWRMAGVAPDTAFQLWMLAVTAGNLLAFFFFLRVCFQVVFLPASLAAVFFASANSLVAQICHQQLLSEVYVIGALAAVFLMFKPKPAGENGFLEQKQWLPAGMFFGCLTLQFYSGFYYGFFVLLLVVAATLGALVSRKGRARFFRVCRTNVLPFALCGALSVSAMVPWLMHYLAAAREVGPRSFGTVWLMSPRIQSWFYNGPENWLYGWSTSIDCFRKLPMETEHRLGIGAVTPLVCLVGLWLRRRTWGIRSMIILSLLVVVTVTWWKLPGVWWEIGIPPLWKFLYETVPGANAIRSIIRAGILLIIPAAIGFAFLLEHLFSQERRGFRYIGVAVAVFCLIEQFSLTGSYDKQTIRDNVARIAQMIKPDCKMFVYTRTGTGAPTPCVMNLDAMWAGLAAEKPAVNGWGGNGPPQWFLDKALDHVSVAEEIDCAVHAWAERYGLNTRDIQWINEGSSESPASE